MNTSNSPLAAIQHKQLVNEMVRLPVLSYRQLNLRKAVKNFDGGLQKVAETLGYANGSFLSQMLSDHATRKVTEKSARSFEQKLGLQPGALDSPTSLPNQATQAAQATTQPMAAINIDLMVELISATCAEFETEGVPIAPYKLSRVLEMALQDALEHQSAVRPVFVKRLVKMIK